jgi:hypothetical protein
MIPCFVRSLGCVAAAIDGCATAATAPDANVINAEAVVTTASPTTTTQRPLRELGIGFAGIRLPDDRGSNQRRGDALPGPFIVSRAEWLKTDRDGASGLAPPSLRSGHSACRPDVVRQPLASAQALARCGLTPPRGRSAALRRLGGG